MLLFVHQLLSLNFPFCSFDQLVLYTPRPLFSRKSNLWIWKNKPHTLVFYLKLTTMKLMELIGEPAELTQRSSYPPTNLDILKHITFKRRQVRKSVHPGSHLFLSISEELMRMCPGDISPYPRLYIFLWVYFLAFYIDFAILISKLSNNLLLVRYLNNKHFDDICEHSYNCWRLD